MVKSALLVGINYPGTDAKFQGCINDVSNMKNCLIKWYGFAEEDIVVLIDTDPDFKQPTGANIWCELNNLVSLAEAGDHLYFYYSGHGTRIPTKIEDDDDCTGYDECIYPCDSNLITDDDFRELVQKVPDGCKMTIVSDSCHSGGLLENAKEQIGDSTKLNIEEATLESCEDFPYEPELEEQDNEGNPVKSRSLPLSSLIKILKEKTGRDNVDVGNIRSTLYDLFGKDASPKFKKFMNVLFKRHQEGHIGGSGSGHGSIMGFLSNLSHRVLKIKDEEEDQLELESESEVYAGSTMNLPNNGVLISGCQSFQISADMRPPEGAYGACTNALLQIIEENEGQVTNRDLVLSIRMRLAEQGLSQQAELYCLDEHLDSPFIC